MFSNQCEFAAFLHFCPEKVARVYAAKTASLATSPDGFGKAVKTRWLPNWPRARCISGFGPLGVLGSYPEAGEGQRQAVTDLKEWNFLALCFVCGRLRVQPRRTGGS